MTHPLSPSDLAGHRRRHDYDLPRDATVYLATRHGASTTGPGPAERADRLAQWHAMHDADVTRLQADLAKHDGLLGCEGWPGELPDLDLDNPDTADRLRRRLGEILDESMGRPHQSDALPDDGPGGIGLPAEGYDPAEGHALREPRSVVPWGRVAAGLIVLGVAAALVWQLVRVWMP